MVINLVFYTKLISIIFIYNAGIDFSSYVTKSGAFILGIQKLLPLFQKTFNGLYFIRKEKLSLNSVLQLLKETKKYKNNSRDKIVNIFELKKSIRFENINFSYKENKVLENINLEKMVKILVNKSYSIKFQVLNYNAQVIGIIASRAQYEGFIPCYPSGIIRNYNY